MKTPDDALNRPAGRAPQPGLAPTATAGYHSRQMSMLTRHLLAYRISLVTSLLVLQFSAVAVVSASDQGSPSSATGGPGSPDISGISMVALGTREGDLGIEGTFELRNGGKQTVTYAGYAAEAPAWTRQCLVNGEWKEDEQGWCGVGLETQTLPPDDRVRFSAQLCRTGEATRVGVAIGAPSQESRELVWSNSVPRSPGR